MPSAKTEQVWVCEVAFLKGILTYHVRLVARPSAWHCPCSAECTAYVVYGRDADHKLHFISTQSATPGGPGVIMTMDTVEDIEGLLRGGSAILHPEDVECYRQWFQKGLKEAMFGDAVHN